MYIIVKDVYGDYGDESEKVIVLNDTGVAEAFRSKQRALRELKDLVDSMEVDYKELEGKNGSVEYSLWGGSEVFYIYKLHVDNSL